MTIKRLTVLAAAVVAIILGAHLLTRGEPPPVEPPREQPPAPTPPPPRAEPALPEACRTQRARSGAERRRITGRHRARRVAPLLVRVR